MLLLIIRKILKIKVKHKYNNYYCTLILVYLCIFLIQRCFFKNIFWAIEHVGSKIQIIHICRGSKCMMYLRCMKRVMKCVLACGRELCVINTDCKGIVSVTFFFIRTHTWSKFIVIIRRAAPLLLQGVMHGSCKFNNSVLGCLGHLGLSH